MRLFFSLFLLLSAIPAGLWAQAFAQANDPGSPAQATAPASRQNAFDSLRRSTPLKQVHSARSFLDKNGVAIGGYLQLDGSHVISGGVPNPLGFDGQYLLDVSTTVDTKKLIGWPGGTVLVDMQTHSGANVVDRQVPGIQDPNNMDADTFTKLDRAWYQQDLPGQNLQLQIGLIYVDDQFLTIPFGANFISLDFSSDSAISTFVLPTYPSGSFGGDATFTPIKGLYFSGGAFRDHSTELPYDPGGILYITEEGWQSKWQGLPYKLQVGAWRDTGRFQRFAGGIVHHASGAYVVASKKLWQPQASSDRGVGMFFQFGSGPPSVAAVRRHYGAGVVWTGPTTTRPHDEIGFAFSDALLTAQSDFIHSFENEFEAYYQFYVSHELTVMPDFEYWLHPGGMTAPQSTLFTVRIQYSF